MNSFVSQMSSFLEKFGTSLSYNPKGTIGLAWKSLDETSGMSCQLDLIQSSMDLSTTFLGTKVNWACSTIPTTKM